MLMRSILATFIYCTFNENFHKQKTHIKLLELFIVTWFGIGN